jgi:hypothetical protein
MWITVGEGGHVPGWLKGLITVVLFTVVPPAVAAAVLGAADTLDGFGWVVVLAGIIGLGYGLEAGILKIYDLGSPAGWGIMVVDLTWSLPNTIWGFVIGNLIFWFFGSPSGTQSTGKHWVSFKPRSATGFGHDVLQTHGTVNLGGTGQHERMHLLQARIFGPAFLPLYFVCYAVTSVLQLAWSATLGWILRVAKVRPKFPLQPPAKSPVGGFFGWIYYATLFELWAFASGNP